jgi:hypothetical protein
MLIKMTLSSIPIYTSISVELPPWLLKSLIKLMKAFFWSGFDQVQEANVLCLGAEFRGQLTSTGLVFLI